MTAARAMMTDAKSQIVGVADSLGWSALHERVDDAGIQRIHDRLVLPNAESAASHGKLRVYTGVDGAQHACADRNAYRVQMIPISDTIVFASSNASADAYFDVILAMRHFLVANVYLRFGCSCGHLGWASVGESCVPNRALWLVFQARRGPRKDQNWHGCMIDNELATRPDLAPLDEALLERKVLAAYPVPRKSRSRLAGERSLVVDWPNANRDRPTPAIVTAAFQNRHGQLSRAGRTKLRNTLLFLAWARPGSQWDQVRAWLWPAAQTGS